ncbi:hypothetical protein INR49_010100 [Caranx melampygus]|nr:hypothetical protein INR49_010100 [Caranx melampygus]
MTMPLPLNESLQEVEIPVISNSECKKSYRGVTDNMICVGVSSGGKNICYGDGGAPMMTKSGSRWVQGGLAIFIVGGSCALPSAPGGFTRVSRYESWIKSQITTNQPGFITSSAFSSVVSTLIRLSVETVCIMEVKLLCAAVLLVSTLSGIDAQLDGAWPWQAMVVTPWLCGGSLINDQWVMTAAQCFISTSTVGVTVYLGRQTLLGPNPNEQHRAVSQIIIHPQYNDTTLDNDIVLVKMSSPVTFNDYIRPVCLAAAGSVYEAGMNTWPPAPDTPLQEVEIPIMSQSECMKNYTVVTDNMICAGTPSGGKSACYGDSGAPMMTKPRSRWVQGGLAIFMVGGSCALPNAPGGFTRVSRYESWIKSQITTNQPGFINTNQPDLLTSSAASSVDKSPTGGLFLERNVNGGTKLLPGDRTTTTTTTTFITPI